MENLLELNFERAANSVSASDKPRGAESAFLFEVSPQAAELYRTFYDAHNAAAAKESGDCCAFYAKAEQLPLRLALILHHLHWAAPNAVPSPVCHWPPASVSPTVPPIARVPGDGLSQTHSAYTQDTTERSYSRQRCSAQVSRSRLQSQPEA